MQIAVKEQLEAAVVKGHQSVRSVADGLCRLAATVAGAQERGAGADG